MEARPVNYPFKNKTPKNMEEHKKYKQLVLRKQKKRMNSEYK